MASLYPGRRPYRPPQRPPWRHRPRRPVLTLIAAATLVAAVECSSSGHGRSEFSAASGDLAGGRYRR